MLPESKNYQNNPEKLIRSFGRIKSRKLSKHKKDLLGGIFTAYKIDPSLPCHPRAAGIQEMVITKEISPVTNPPGYPLREDEKKGKKRNEKNILEIGFGFGDFLFANAKNNPEINFFGAEPHLNGVVNLLAKLENEPLKNIKISTTDIRILLENFPENFFDKIYILFPDPWPKVKHFKRRLINIDFLDNILSPKLKPSGTITIATDHDSYKTWILAEVLRCKKFSWIANSKKDWQIFPDDWIMTKYQKKALDEGRVPVIFDLTHS